MASCTSATYGAISIITVYAVSRFLTLSFPWVYTALAVSSAAASAPWCVSTFRRRGPSTTLGLREILVRHWSYARWNGLGAVLNWIPWNAWYLLLPLATADTGLRSSGELRAAVNLVQPMVQTNAAIATQLTSRFSADRERGDRRGPWRQVRVVLAASVVFGVVTALFGSELSTLLYGGSYAIAPSTFALLGAVPAFYGAYAVLRAYCLAQELLALPVRASVAANLVTIPIALWWLPIGASQAAAGCILLAFFVQALWLAGSTRVATVRVDAG
jgi:O-antigen/teichoic acid export membrane protein